MNNKNGLEVRLFALSILVRTVITQKLIRISSFVKYFIKNNFSKRVKAKISKTNVREF